jgi:cyclopropane fatty-acyl-phospholipid synthase-like methyltransferase
MAATLARLTIPRLGIREHHQLLEIGCGNGTAVSAVAERLATGTILAIDRSAATVARATQRNADHIARGVARIVQVDLADLVVPAGHFHTIFAVNVNLFQANETDVVEFLRRALRRRGRLVLGYRRRDADHLYAQAERTCSRLLSGGLTGAVTDWAAANCLFVTAERR